MLYLNLVFHDIVETENELNNKYTVTIDYFNEIIREIELIISKDQAKFQDFRIYFDDGRDSFANFFSDNKKVIEKSNLAIVTDLIDTNGYLNFEQLEDLQSRGATISSHGVSHAALATYIDNTLITNNLEGFYENSKIGKGRSLSKNEVLYQVIESKRKLEKLLRPESIKEFVLPYGLYNDLVVQTISKTNLYRFVSTCDEILDKGTYLRPRFLIHNEITVAQTIQNILSLT
jgi:hypothetical protein